MMEHLQIDWFLQGSFDFLIVRGGTTGLVLAARLSDQDHVRFGVIEAGSSKLGGFQGRFTTWNWN